MPASFNNPHQEDAQKVAQERDVVAEHSSQPRKTDAVLGGKAPTPIYGVVLGGIEGVKNRLASGVPQQRTTAFPEALKYGQQGWELVLQALNDQSSSVVSAAYALLQENAEPALKRALRVYNPGLRLKCYRTLTCFRSPAGHLYATHSVAISPDGQILASGSEDQTIKLWDLPSGELRTTLTGHSGQVRSVAISPDGQILASGSEDQTIKLWDLPSGELKTTLTGHSHKVYSLAISPDGQILASASEDNTIKLWRIENPSQPRLAPVEFFHHYLTLKEALNSDWAGLGQVIQALKDKSWEIRFIAGALLQESEEPVVKQALQEYSSEVSSAVALYS